MASDNTGGKQRGLIPFKPGQSGNPKGRPKGSRNKINDVFLQDFLEAWEAFGRPALLATAWTDPAAFVKVAAALLPKELTVQAETTIRYVARIPEKAPSTDKWQEQHAPTLQ